MEVEPNWDDIYDWLLWEEPECFNALKDAAIKIWELRGRPQLIDVENNLIKDEIKKEIYQASSLVPWVRNLDNTEIEKILNEIKIRR